MKVGNEYVHALKYELNGYLENAFLECSPFLLGWYNKLVDEQYCLTEYSAETLVFCVISHPAFVDKSVLSFYSQLLNQNGNFDSIHDHGIPCHFGLIDSVVWYKIHQCISQLKKNRPLETCLSKSRIVLDSDMRPNQFRPVFAVNVCAHVSGLAFYHRLEEDAKAKLRNDGVKCHMSGLSLHPRFGGNFAIRGCIIFPNIVCQNFPMVEPISPIEPHAPPFPHEEVVAIIREFNTSWQGREWRDRYACQDANCRYSEFSAALFAAPADERKHMILRQLKDSDQLF